MCAACNWSKRGGRTDSLRVTWPLLRSDSPWPGISELQYSNVTLCTALQALCPHTLCVSPPNAHKGRTHAWASIFTPPPSTSAKSSFSANKHLDPHPHPRTWTHTRPRSCLRPFSSRCPRWEFGNSLISLSGTEQDQTVSIVMLGRTNNFEW